MSESRENKIPVLFSHSKARRRSHQGKKCSELKTAEEERQEDIQVTY